MRAEKPAETSPARPPRVADRLLVIGVLLLAVMVLLLAFGARPTDPSRAQPAAVATGRPR
jgi:hypothetical protein